uniref:Bm418 n=1 Tax=Brugia malayi TaxID=6279 RepID=A0A0J9XSJ7_BRUMA|nr:Bm418 [Brugia malayi]
MKNEVEEPKIGFQPSQTGTGLQHWSSGQGLLSPLCLPSPSVVSLDSR